MLETWKYHHYLVCTIANTESLDDSKHYWMKIFQAFALTSCTGLSDLREALHIPPPRELAPYHERNQRLAFAGHLIHPAHSLDLEPYQTPSPTLLHKRLINHVTNTKQHASLASCEPSFSTYVRPSVPTNILNPRPSPDPRAPLLSSQPPFRNPVSTARTSRAPES